MGADGVNAVVAAQGHVQKLVGLAKVAELLVGAKVAPFQLDHFHLKIKFADTTKYSLLALAKFIG